MTEILACPFCGSPAKTVKTVTTVDGINFTMWGIHCANLHPGIECSLSPLTFNGYASEQAAIYHWNTRFGYPFQGETVAEDDDYEVHPENYIFKIPAEKLYILATLMGYIQSGLDESKDVTDEEKYNYRELLRTIGQQVGEQI